MKFITNVLTYRELKLCMYQDFAYLQVLYMKALHLEVIHVSTITLEPRK